MHILVLEGYPYIDITRLRSYIDPTKHTLYTLDDEYDPAQIEVVMARGTYPVDAALLDAHPQVTYALRVGVGIDNFDKEACTSRGVEIINRPGSNSSSVAELALRGLIGLLRKSQQAYTHIIQHQQIPDRHHYLSHEITSQTIGFLGFGNIAQEIMKRLVGFSPARVLYYDPFVAESVYEAEKVDHIEDVASRSDCIFATLPLLEATRGMVNTGFLTSCKPHVQLINVSRGGIVNEQELCEFLEKHPMAGFYTDVWNDEPSYTASLDQLLQLDNVIMTPHICAETHEAQDRMHWFELLA